MTQATTTRKLFPIGTVVLVQPRKYGPVHKAVVMDNNGKAMGIARLRKDGTIRQETLWTGLYNKVTKA